MNWLFFFFFSPPYFVYSFSKSSVCPPLFVRRWPKVNSDNTAELREHGKLPASEHRFDRLKVHLNVSRSVFVCVSAVSASESKWSGVDSSGQQWTAVVSSGVPADQQTDSG